jgi:tetratricopeptide (TPR) repeat protein
MAGAGEAGMIRELQPPDSLHLRAAEGWLGLGNWQEANEELERITPQLLVHPDVLKMRWEIYVAAKKWEAALFIATALVQMDPDNPLGWIHQSYCLHELGLTADARRHLMDVADKFPINATIRYNLACYECRLGRLRQAKQWLEKAFEIGDTRKMKLAALNDTDLEPLWESLREP